MVIRDKVYMIPNPPTPNNSVDFDPDICIGCNRCIEVCRNDVLMPNPEAGKPPLVIYTDECRYCGCCVEECGRPSAIKMIHPLNQSIVMSWKRKDTGEVFRLGMKTPKQQPNTRPPLG
jgi:Na+-translocating ferredoxin:NAD+ oxidoreductase RNF subunit RnfB